MFQSFPSSVHKMFMFQFFPQKPFSHLKKKFVRYSTNKMKQKFYQLLRPISKNLDEAERHLFVVVVIISVGSNAVAAYTGNNHACLQHKRFTDNDRDQQTYRSDRKRTQFVFSQCKNDQCSSKNTHAVVPEKLTISFWPNLHFFLPKTMGDNSVSD